MWLMPINKVDTSITNSLHDTALSISSGLLNLIKLGWTFGNEGVMTLAASWYIFHNQTLLEGTWMVAVGNIGGPLLFLAIYISSTATVRRSRSLFGYIDGSRVPQRACCHCGDPLRTARVSFNPSISSRFWKWVVIVVAVLMMLFIGFSRLFVGGHYLTDIMQVMPLD